MFELLNRRMMLSTWVAAKVAPQGGVGLGLLEGIQAHHREAVMTGRKEVDSPASRELRAQLSYQAKT